MAFQSSARSVGFRARNAPDKSKQLANTAKNLDKDRVDQVTQMTNNANSVAKEYERIFSIASNKDKYELDKLAKFSESLNNALDTAAKKVYKPWQDKKREEGLIEGTKAANGDPTALAKVALSTKQTQEIEQRVEAQIRNTASQLDEIEKAKLKNKLTTTLEEEYKLLNIRKLGSNISYGFKRGYLQESAKNWPAYLTAELGGSEDEITVFRKTDKERTVKIGSFWDYEPDVQNEILGYVQQKFVEEKDNGMSKDIVQTYLLNPVTAHTSKFTKEVLGTHIREQATKEIDALEIEITNAIAVADETPELLHEKMTTALITLKGAISRKYYGKQLEGTMRETANELLATILVNGLSSSDANFENIDAVQNFLETRKYEIEGVNKGNPKTLPELWQKKFDVDTIIGNAIKANGQRIREENLAINTNVQLEANKMLVGFYKREEGFDKATLSERIKEINKEFGHVEGISAILTDLQDELESPKWLSYEETVEAIRDATANKDTNEVLTSQTYKWNQKAIDEAEEQGKLSIVDNKFITTAAQKEALNTGVTNIKNLILKKGFASVSKEDREALGIGKAEALARKIIVQEAIRHQKLKGESVTQQQALDYAITHVTGEIQKDYNDDGESSVLVIDGVEVTGAFAIGTDDRWEYDALNLSPEGGTDSSLDIAAKERTIIDNFKTKRSNDLTIDVAGTTDLGIPPEQFVRGTDGRLTPFWYDLASADPRRNAIQIYNAQAKIKGLPEIDYEDLPEEQRVLLEQTETMSDQDIKTMKSGSSKAIERLLEKNGSISLQTAINSIEAVLPDQNFKLNNEELQGYLKAAGVKEMSMEELLNDPVALKKVKKLRMDDLVLIVNEQTDDVQTALQMLTAGWYYGTDQMVNHEVYNTVADRGFLNYIGGTYYPSNVDNDLYAALNLDPEDIVEIKDGNAELDPYNPLTVNLSKVDSVDELLKIQSDINAIEEPAKKLERKFESAAERNSFYALNNAGLVKKVFGLKPFSINPEYITYTKQKQAVDDRILIAEALKRNFRTDDKAYNLLRGSEFIKNERIKVLSALERVVGKELVADLIETAKATPGFSEDRSLFDPRQRNWAILNQLIRDNTQFGDYDFIESDDDYFTISQEYRLGGPNAGYVPEKDLIKLDNESSQLRKLIAAVSPVDFKVGETEFYGQLLNPNNDGETIKIRKDVAPDLIKLLIASKQAGYDIKLNSGYRNYAEQKEEFEKDSELAKPPGESYHNLGTAIDFNFGDNPEAYQWLVDNAEKFNFRPFAEGLNMDDPEAWHFEWTLQP